MLGLFAGLTPPTSPVLIGIGGALSVSGLWNLTNPMPIGIAIASSCLAAVGVYNIASMFMVAASGGQATPIWAVLGTWQIVWGVQGYQRYRRFANAHEQNVTDSDRQAADRMLAALQKAKLKDNPDVIEFVARMFPATRVRARLMPEGALCVIGADQTCGWRAAPSSMSSCRPARSRASARVSACRSVAACSKARCRRSRSTLPELEAGRCRTAAPGRVSSLV